MEGKAGYDVSDRVVLCAHSLRSDRNLPVVSRIRHNDGFEGVRERMDGAVIYEERATEEDVASELGHSDRRVGF